MLRGLAADPAALTLWEVQEPLHLADGPIQASS